MGRPALETGGAMLGAPRDTPSPSSSSSCSSTSPMTKTSRSLLDSSSISAEPLTPLLKAMEKITGAQRTEVISAMEQLEEVMVASLPPSPEISEDETSPRASQTTSSPKVMSEENLLPSSRRLFSEESPPPSFSAEQSPSKLNLDSSLDLSQL